MKNCKACGKEFPTSGSRKYCSDECYTKAHTKQFTCEVCGNTFERYAHGKTVYRTCGKTCGGKLAYSKHDGLIRPEVQERAKQTLKENGHKPIIRGGNGKGTTVPQDVILSMLQNDWVTEYALTLGEYKEAGFPHHYKIDIANPKLKIAVEIDGESHRAKIRQMQDRKKERKLLQMGWVVIRFSNEDVMTDPLGCLEDLECLMG